MEAEENLGPFLSEKIKPFVIGDQVLNQLVDPTKG